MLRHLAFLLVLGVLTAPSPAWGENEAMAEVAALKARGGHVATLRLGALLTEDATEIRLAALGALAEVGLRSEATAEAVRQALETTHTGERTAALAALGRVGDGADVETFLGALREEDPGVRSAALRGLRVLSGRRLPASPTRCALWWRSSARGMRKSVRTAMTSLWGATDRQRQAWSEDLVRDGWVERRAVEASVHDWLHAPDHKLRAIGFRVAASLRLADAVSDVESALPFVSDIDAEAGMEAVRALGVAPELLPPYWQKRLDCADEEP